MTHESTARTRSFARVLGPFILVIATIVMFKASTLGDFIGTFFGNPVLVWVVGAILLFAGIFIIAFHQYWRSVAAVIISLFGWFLFLRGVGVLAVPQLYNSAANVSLNYLPFAEIGFGLLALAGLWLTYVGWISRNE